MTKMEFLFSTVIFPTRKDSKDIISQSDNYTSTMSLFDLRSRVKRLGQVSESDYLEYASRNMIAWNYYEIDYLKKRISECGRKILAQGFKFKLPKEIYILKSTLDEEGGARGYTRNNSIILNYKRLSQHLIEHELFHIISRYNPELKDLLYKTIGFYKCNEIVIPESSSLFKITNPDACGNNYYININTKEGIYEVIMSIYSDRSYAGGRFFGYLKKGLLAIKGPDYDKKVFYNDGKPLIIDYEIALDLYAQIGRNTHYDIHPEEITADHFVLALNNVKNNPNQNIIDNVIITLVTS